MIRYLGINISLRITFEGYPFPGSANLQKKNMKNLYTCTFYIFQTIISTRCADTKTDARVCAFLFKRFNLISNLNAPRYPQCAVQLSGLSLIHSHTDDDIFRAEANVSVIKRLFPVIKVIDSQIVKHA